MDIPPGVSTAATIGKVWRLKKTIYGLKQSPRVWFGKFQRAVVRFGYKQGNSDHTMFVKRKGEKVTVLIVYVDDIVIIGNDTCEIADIKRRLASEFEMKDLGKLRYFLGIEVSRSPGGIFLSQRMYTLDLLNETGMLGCRPADSPIEANHKLCGDTGDTLDRIQYQRLVGRLIYLSHTRPDIAYAGGVDLKAAPGKGVMFTNNKHLGVESYTDADWAGCLDDRRSTSGYCTSVGGNLVTWRRSNQWLCYVVLKQSTELWLEAARYDDMDDMIALASAGVSLDSKDSEGRTVVCTIVVMARAGKSTACRPSASTQVQDQDHSQAHEPGGDRETLQEQPLTQHTPVLERLVTPRDARNVMELNQYKYTNVPIAEEHMANLTSNELAEAIRLYRDEQARLQIKYEQDEEQEESGDSQQSRRSVFDRIGAKEKKSQKEPSKKETEATRKKKLEEIREQIRKEEEAKLEQKIQKRMQLEERLLS
ncbi:hypothetical protein AgCh_004391 [Apium graveolens]